MMISLIQLEYIIAVDTYRHFVTASEKCFVTQPTLSMQIKKMEDELGVVIFDRTKQPIIPTDVGKKIIEQARIIVAESKKMEDIVAEHSMSVRGELSIGIIPSLAPYLLPMFIGKFIKKYPEIHVKVTELLTETIIAQLKNERLDVGILVTPLEEKGIFEEVLFYEEIYLYANKNHPLARTEKIKMEALAGPDLWLLNDGNCFRNQVINLCQFAPDLGKRGQFDYASGSLETIKKFVETEGGYSLMPALAIDKNNVSAKVVVKPLAAPTPLREVSVAYTRNYAKRRLLQLLADEIKVAVPSGMHEKGSGYIVEWRQSRYSGTIR